jgi:hypothetical protein
VLDHGRPGKPESLQNVTRPRVEDMKIHLDPRTKQSLVHQKRRQQKMMSKYIMVETFAWSFKMSY